MKYANAVKGWSVLWAGLGCGGLMLSCCQLPTQLLSFPLFNRMGEKRRWKNLVGWDQDRDQLVIGKSDLGNSWGVHRQLQIVGQWERMATISPLAPSPSFQVQLYSFIPNFYLLLTKWHKGNGGCSEFIILDRCCSFVTVKVGRKELICWFLSSMRPNFRRWCSALRLRIC